MRQKLLSLLLLCVVLSVQGKTKTEGIYLYTTLDDNTCKVEQANASAQITDSKIEIPAVVDIDGKAYQVTTVPEKGFYSSMYNYRVTEIILPEGLTSIGNSAFANYQSVKELVIPNSVTELGEGAFDTNGGLKKVTIGKGISNIPARAFARASNIDNVIMRASVPPTLDATAFQAPFFITLTVPKGSKEAYATAPNYDKFMTIIEDGAEIIEVPMPEISLSNDNMVTITCSDPRASIYYTFGTISPTKQSTLYTEPFKLEKATTVRAKAFIEDFQSYEVFANLEPRVQLTLPDSLLVYLNGHPAWGSGRNMAWHKYPIDVSGEASRVGDILSQACVWAEPCGDLLYMFTYDSFSENPEYLLTTFDRGTMEFVGQEPLPAGFIANDVAVDPVTGNIYGVFSSKEGTHFGYVNLETKTVTKVKAYDLMYNASTVDRVMAFCFSPEGVGYGLTFGGRLVRFDRATGDYTVVGETKWNINFVSCARWDEKTGMILYSFTDQDSTHSFYTINPETAERSKFETLPGSVSAFFTPLDYVKPKAPAIPENVTLSFPEGGRTGKLSFKAPVKSQNGDEMEGTLNYRILRKGKTISEGTVRAGAIVNADLTSPVDGIVKYAVVLSNNYGESLRGVATAFAGVDVPATPSVQAVETAEGIELKWDAVTTGANGGYINKDNITYTVTRFPGKETLAAKITDTTFTDKTAVAVENEVKQYYYTVTANCGDAVSAAGKSNKIVLGHFIPTWTENFSTSESMDNFTIVNKTEYEFDEDNSSGWQWNGYDRTAGVFYHPYSELDDWLITPPLMMEKGKTYRLSFKAGAYPGRFENYLEVFNGNDNTPDAMTNKLIDKFNVYSSTDGTKGLKEYSVDIVPEQDGLQYIGFHCVSKPNQLWLYLDDISVLEGIVEGAPKAVEDLTIAADETGLLKATVSFKLPTMTVDDKAIEGTLKVQISRGGEVIYSEEGKRPGEEMTYTDEKVGTHGNQDYNVRAYSGNVAGMEALSTVFVGNYLPLSVSNVTAVENAEKYGEVTISWEAPATDERGRRIASENLTYEIVYAWADGRTDTLVSDVKETSYTYSAKQPTDKEQFVTYQVWAYTPYGKSNVAWNTEEQTPVGASYKAPWHESFNVVPPVAPLGVSIINGTFGSGWSVYNDSEGVVAQDEDNCFGGYFGSAENNSGSMYTGKLDLSGLSDPMLEFYVYKMGPEDINTLEVQVGGFGTWDSMDFISMDQLHEGWNKVEISLEDYKGKTIQVKWIATVKLYSYVLMDNLKIDSVVSVNGIDSERTPVSSRFFTIDGLEVKTPAPGTPCIVVTTYSDGSVARQKLMAK